MKGILMKPDSIGAIIEGRKTQTRRLGGLKEINEYPDQWELMPGHDANSLIWLFHNTEISEIASTKPRYYTGETVYIKEKALYWVSPILEGVEYDKPSDWWTDCVYQDDPEIPALLADNGRLVLERSINQIVEGSPIVGKWEWKSPMFMPEHYARHFRTITDVRAERVQEITVGDAKREGITDNAAEEFKGYIHYPFIGRFKELWNSINKDYPWESNPFVWVYTFRREDAKN